MIETAQSLRDKVLWELANRGKKLERSRLRRCAGMRLADLDPILEKLEKEGRIIRQPSSTDKEMIILRTDRQNLIPPARTPAAIARYL
jgi:DNA-binding MarR family transcriptional regulator